METTLFDEITVQFKNLMKKRGYVLKNIVFQMDGEYKIGIFNKLLKRVTMLIDTSSFLPISIKNQSAEWITYKTELLNTIQQQTIVIPANTSISIAKKIDDSTDIIKGYIIRGTSLMEYNEE